MKRLFCVMMGTAGLALSAQAADVGPEDAVAVVRKYKAVWTKQPGRTPAPYAVDGPVMGNGDMKVALGGPAEEQQFYLQKNDMWRLKSQYGQSSPVGFGHLAIRIPALKGATYNLTQTWAAPRTVGAFSKDGTTVRMTSLVAATRNLLVVELEAEGKEVRGDAILHVQSGRGSLSETKQVGDVVVGRRAFRENVDIKSGVAVAWKAVGGTSSALEGEADGEIATKRYRVNIGREQLGKGRWGFKGAVDELHVYGKALKPAELRSLMAGKSPGSAMEAWSMDKAPPSHAGIKLVDGRHGRAWQFNGSAASYLDCGDLVLPIKPLTLACWIRIDDAAMDGNANYILSCGEWNQGVSLGLVGGKLRFTVDKRHVESAVLEKGRWIHVAGTWDGSQMAACIDGEKVKNSGSSAAAPIGISFTLKPGRPLILVMTMDSVFKNENYVRATVRALSDISSEADVADVKKQHAVWWVQYWGRSFVEIGDPLLETQYYRSLYAMGALSRDPVFPPGLFGIVTTDSPAWAGDYHLNYNHMAPYYALYSANRVEQGDPQDAPLLDFRERGRWYVNSMFEGKMRGVQYPVGIGPLGIETTRGGHPRHAEKGGLFFGQRSNASYGLVNIAQRWRTTLDPVYGKRVYPFVVDVVDFWEDYLKYEEGPDGKMRYVDYDDAIHEGSGKNMNPILALGLLKNAFDLALDMSKELGVDEGRRKKWSDILENISPWATQQRGGKEVFRYSENGTAWWRDNTLGIQHIYPGNAIGLDSDPKWRKISVNTIDVMGRWRDINGTSSFFPAAVRVGYDPSVILKQLQGYAKNTYPNGFQIGNPHGIENLSTVPNTINEMLCMSHVPAGMNPGGHVLRVFPVWPKTRDARFVNIRSWGAFLVSSELKGGKVQYVDITSERGKDCTMVNPWPKQVVTLTRGDKTTETLTPVVSAKGEERFTFKTKAGETLSLVAQPR